MFHATDFMPRGECGNWPEPLRILYITGHTAVFLAFMVIPFTLYLAYLYARKTGNIAHSSRMNYRINLGFALFIFFCGSDHLLEGVLSFYWPNYYFFTLWVCLTAIISWYVALILPAYFVKALRGDISND